MTQVCFGSIRRNRYSKDYAKDPYYNGVTSDSKIIKTIKEQVPKGGTIADIGAGQGRNTRPLAKMGYNVDAFEIDDEGIRQIKAKTAEFSGVKVFEEGIFNQRLEPQKYDAAIMAHLTQHFDSLDIASALANIYNGLKRGGIAIFDALIEKDKTLPPISEKNMGEGNAHFSFDTIKKLAQNLGFSITNIEDYKESASSRGNYYGPSWGFKDSTTPLETVLPVKLKWFTFKKL